MTDPSFTLAQIEKVKKRLKSLCRPGLHVRPEFAWPLADEEPFEVRCRIYTVLVDRRVDLANPQVVKETIELMRHHRSVMHHNWETMAVEKIQVRWCCGEYPYLFRGECECGARRWGRLT